MAVKMATTAPEHYQGAIDEVIVHLAAALAAQERADAIEGDEHTQRQRSQVHPLDALGASTLEKRWRGPDLERAVAVMTAEKKEVTR